MKKIIRLASVCALAGVALLTACTKDYSVDIAKVQTDVNAANTEIAALKTTVGNLTTSVNAINTELTSIKSTLATKADKTAVEALTTRVVALEKTAETLKADLAAAVAKFANYYTMEETNNIIKNYYTKTEVEDMVDKAEKACYGYTESQVEQCFKNVMKVLEGYATLENLDDAKTELKKYSDDNLKLANTYTDEKMKAHVEEFQQKLNDLETECKKYSDEKLNAAVKVLNEAIQALVDRVQSLSFVPEFTTKNTIVAAGKKFVRNRKELKANLVTVDATFAVKPANKTNTVYEAIKAGNAKLVYVNTKERTQEAKAAGTVETAEIAKVRVNETTGNIDIVANLTKVKDEASIALVYKLDENTEISSEYVSVDIDVIDVLEMYVLYNPTTEKYYEGQKVEKPWDVVPAQVDWYAGYNLYIEDNGNFYTPAEFAKTIGLAENALDLTYTVKYTDNSNKALEYPKDGTKAVTLADFHTDYTRMVSDIEVTKANVGKFAKSAAVFSYTEGTKVVPVLEFANTYTIGKRTIDIELEGIEGTIDWSYKLAVALSSKVSFDKYLDMPMRYNTEEAFTKNFFKLALQFKEQKVVKPESFTEDQKKSIYDLLEAPSKTTTVLNGQDVTDDPKQAVKMILDDVAIVKGHIASVNVSNYHFSKDMDNIYFLTNSYENATDKLNIKFSMTLGAQADDASLEVPAAEIAFPATAPITAPATKTFEEFYNAQKEYFTNYAEFKSAFDVVSRTSKTMRETGKESKRVSNTYLDMLSFGKEKYVLGASDVTSYSNVFNITNVYTTWYGAVYTVTGKITLAAPAQKLDFWTDRVDTTPAAVDPVVADASLIAARADVKGVSELEGSFEWEVEWFSVRRRYYVNNDDLSKYFKAVGIESARRQYYRVEYTVLNKTADDKKAYADVPELSKPTVFVVNVDKCELSSSPIDWYTYANRTLMVKANLIYNQWGTDVAVDSKTVFLWTAQPLTVATKTVEKPFATNTTIDMYSYEALSIFGIVNPDRDLVLERTGIHDAVGLATNIYGFQISLPEAEDVKVKFNGEEYTIPTFPGKKLSWNSYTGKLSYKTDASTLVNPVTVEVPVTVDYYYRYWGNKADQTEFVLTYVIKNME